MSFQHSGFQHNAFQVGVEGGAAAQAENYKTTIAAPQQIGAREFVGYALSFAALAALLAGTPPTQGAANYNVGSQQATLANSQDRSWIKGTPPTLIPAAAAPQIPRPLQASPQQVDSGFTLIFGPTPESAATVILHTQVAAPEQIDSGTAAVYGPQPETASAVTPKTLTAVPQLTDSASARVFRYPPIVVAAPDSPVAYFRFSAPEQIDSGFTRVFGSPSSDRFILSRYFVAEQESTEQWGGKVWGRVIEQAAGTDVPAARTLVSAPAQVDSAATWIYHPPTTLIPEPQVVGGANYTVGGNLIDSGLFVKTGRFVVSAVAGADVKQPGTLISAPEQVDSGNAWLQGVPPESVQPASKIAGTQVAAPQQIESGFVAFHRSALPDGWFVSKYYEADQESTEQWGGRIWGTAVAAPLGTDVPVGRFRSYAEPFYEPVQYGLAIRPNADLIPPAVIPPATPEVTPAGRHKRPRWFVEIDGQTFQVASREDAIALLEQAKQVAEKPAKAAAAMAVRRALKAGLVPKPLRTPKIASDAPELQDIVVKAREALEGVYRNALVDAELKLRVAKQRKDDDNDDDDVLLLM